MLESSRSKNKLPDGEQTVGVVVNVLSVGGTARIVQEIQIKKNAGTRAETAINTIETAETGKEMPKCRLSCIDANAHLMLVTKSPMYLIPTLLTRLASA